MRALAQEAPALFFVKNARDLRFECWSRHLSEASGIDASEIEGGSGDLIFPRGDLAQYQACDRAVITERVVVGVDERVACRRATMWSHTRKIPILDGQGNVTQILGIVEDITGDRRREGARDELYDELIATLKEREMLLSTVAHDLATPRAALSISPTMMMRKLAEASSATATSTDLSNLQRLTAHILSAAKRMDGLVCDLSARNALAAGRLSIAPHDAHELAREAYELIAPLAAERGLDLRHLRAGAPLIVACDRERILRVLSNLLGNAIKFTCPGGVVLLETAGESSAARFSVTDSGPGIPPEQTARVFDAYWQADAHRDRGSGLGLWIAKQIVERHGGRIGVESEPGRGSTFFFTLLLRP
jgi:PAS domain S-box-containing protein